MTSMGGEETAQHVLLIFSESLSIFLTHNVFTPCQKLTRVVLLLSMENCVNDICITRTDV